MQVEPAGLPGVLLITPNRATDNRGFFAETWNRKKLADAEVDLPDFVQDNHSMSYESGTVRGLHFQFPPHAQGKLVRCGRGRLFDVAVDIRLGSPAYGRWIGVELSAENGRQLWIPPGFLHGFATRAPDTELVYKCTDYYSPRHEGAILWNSPEFAIDWGVSEPILSPKDAAAPPFAGFETPFVFESPGR